AASRGGHWERCGLAAVAGGDRRVCGGPPWGPAEPAGRGVFLRDLCPHHSSLHLQACAHPRGGVSLPGAACTATLPYPHCPRARGPVSADRRDAARAAGLPLHGGGPHRARHSLLAAGPASGLRALGLFGGPPLSHPPPPAPPDR